MDLMPHDGNGLVILMGEQAKLIIGPRENVYRCSLCGQAFSPSDGVAAKEAMAKVWAAFHEHVKTIHDEASDANEAESGLGERKLD